MTTFSRTTRVKGFFSFQSPTEDHSRSYPRPNKYLKVLKEKRFRGVQIVWAPVHSALPGNDRAHEAARGLSFRECPETSELSLRLEGRDRMVAYREIIAKYRLGRIIYSAQHFKQMKTSRVAPPSIKLRPKPAVVRLLLPRAIRQHLSKPSRNKQTTPEQWETVVRSSDPGVQLRAVQMAEDATRAQTLLVAV